MSNVIQNIDTVNLRLKKIDNQVHQEVQYEAMFHIANDSEQDHISADFSAISNTMAFLQAYATTSYSAKV